MAEVVSDAESEGGLGAGVPRMPYVVRAFEIPELMGPMSDRKRLVPIRQFCKDWALEGMARRLEMIERPPRYERWWHRFTERRFDLPRIAAVVEALCERDGVPCPAWALRHRSRRAVTLVRAEFPSGLWHDRVRAEAPPACERHNVWFKPVELEDIRVHGARQLA